MSMTAGQIEAYVDASAAALDLRLRPEYREGVLRYFALAADMAALLDAVALEAHAEPAVNFVPVAPARGSST